VDAVAHPGCEADKVPFRAISVPKGETYQITIFAKAQNSTVTQAYAIRVKRLDGTETELKTLRILGAQLSPEFNGGLREYTTTMVVAREFVNVAYVLLDAGQKVHITAAAQTGSGGNVSRRLQMLGEQLQAGAQTARVTGEVQDFERTQLFPIDQGHSRRLTVSIESADPMSPRDGTYTVTVLREGCTAARPLFDPVSRSCVVNCGAGFYENSESSRCSRCNANCAVCAGLLRCELCRQDTPHLSYIIQQDGSCLGVQSTLLGKYYWWCISLGIFAAALLCMLIGVLCQFICTCCCCPERDRYGFDTDSEAEFESERLLG